jgi:hypothetical protein
MFAESFNHFDNLPADCVSCVFEDKFADYFNDHGSFQAHCVSHR